MSRLSKSVVIFHAFLAASHFVTFATGIQRLVATAEVASKISPAMQPGYMMELEDFSTAPLGPITTATFTAMSTLSGTYSVGTIQANSAEGGIKYRSKYGGKFLQTPEGQTTTFKPHRPLQYFGMWISRLQADGITVKFYNGSVTIQTFTAADIIALLSDVAYKTNPYSKKAETDTYFAFVNFLCTGENTFDKVEIIAGLSRPVNTDRHTIGYQMNLIVTPELPRVYSKTALKGYTLGQQDFDRQTKNYNIATHGELTLPFESSASGTYTTAGKIAGYSADGGAGKTGNYLRTEGGSSGATTTLTVSQPLQYFGMWMSKLHKDDLILKFYDGPDLVQKLPSEYIFLLLESHPSSAAYVDNPNASYFARASFTAFYSFINFEATEKVKFDRVEIIAGRTKVACTDNHTIGFKTVADDV